MFVSHHRHFVTEVANRIIEITPEGLQDFKGSYQDYLNNKGSDHLNRNESAKKVAVTDEKVQSQVSYAQRKNQLRKIEQLEKKVTRIETDIEALETKISGSNEQLALAYEGKTEMTPEAIMTLSSELEIELETQMNLWEAIELELSTLKEDI